MMLDLGRVKEKQEAPKTWEEVLAAELEIIRARRHTQRAGAPDTGDAGASEIDQKLPEAETPSTPGDAGKPAPFKFSLIGLAFSGGGIRSATFNLGVLQALADLDLLKRIDYLSTVSGGGYIGSWFSALLCREPDSASENGNGGEASEKQDKKEKKSDLKRVQALLKTEKSADRPNSDDSGQALDPIGFLRKYSNYLTPSVGLFSADTWTVVAIYLRNLGLNLILISAFFSALLLLPRLFAFLPLPPSQTASASVPAPALTVFTPIALVLLASCFIGYNLGHLTRKNRRYSSEFRDVSRTGEHPQGPPKPRCKVKDFFLQRMGIQIAVIFPIFLATILSAQSLSYLQEYPATRLAAFGAFLYLIACALIVLTHITISGVKVLTEERAWWKSGYLIVLPIALGCCLALVKLLPESSISDLEIWKSLTFGAPLLTIALLSLTSLHIGLIGRQINDYVREWWGRISAWLLIYSVAWLLFFTVLVYGPPLLATLPENIRIAILFSWLALTIAGLLAGSRGSSRAGQRLPSLIVNSSPYIFILGLFLCLALALDFNLSKFSGNTSDGSYWFCETAPSTEDSRASLAHYVDLYTTNLSESPLRGLAALGIFISLLFFLGVNLDVNEFSMHRLYRNRLIRCYLGARLSPDERKRTWNSFTGFNPEYDISLPNLATENGPYHLLNATLNLASGDDLAWQERKAASFIFSQQFCGYKITSTEAYRPTAEYAKQGKKALTLGAALAISGAAASPNMGFRTTPAYSFLLALFNVRLGWWIGNTNGDQWETCGPTFGLRWLLREVFGSTDARSSFIYLSDGGHFDNLGIYELVRRRCRFIIASDAVQDSELKLKDLGNTLRKCRIDFGVDIDLDTSPIQEVDNEGHSRWHCVVGTIHYDRVNPEDGKGLLLYLKSSLTGDEPQDILSYSAQDPLFPHHSTADQWFDETQFESYRRLGHHIAMKALEATNGTEDSNIEDTLHRIATIWHPPPEDVSPGTFSRHGKALSDLFTTLRNSYYLRFLHAQFYPEWDSLHHGRPAHAIPTHLPATERERTEGFYFCNSLIQLMENVYLDLNLERYHSHPDNRGWMNLFKHWSWSAMFRVTWAICAATYGHRFQSFCEKRLDLEGLMGLTLVNIEESTSLSLDSGYGLEGILNETQTLNFHEKYIIRKIRNPTSNEQSEQAHIDTIYSIQIEIPLPGAIEKKVTFCCGFALIHAKKIIAYRIQDHLRKMGLGRKGLILLREELGHLDVALEIPDGLADEFPISSQKKFAQLVHSVNQEFEWGTS